MRITRIMDLLSSSFTSIHSTQPTHCSCYVVKVMVVVRLIGSLTRVAVIGGSMRRKGVYLGDGLVG
jgi:hypothetical protein